MGTGAGGGTPPEGEPSQRLADRGTPALADPDEVHPFGSYADEAAALLGLLYDVSGLDVLMVTRVDAATDAQEVVAALVGGSLSVIPTQPWSGSACLHMTSGTAPAVAPRLADVPAYATAANLASTDLSCYAGVAIQRGDGAVYGTVCGFGAKERDDTMWELLPRFRTVARSLGALLAAADLADERVAQAQRSHAVQLGRALTDPVTGLANRTGLERAIDSEAARQARYGHVATVVVCDVDGLKAVNDRDGHAAGDAVLARVADTLRSVCRASDILGRAGGDEFLMILPSENDDGPALARLRRVLADLPLSVGAADTRHSRDLSAAWALADRRMYEDKQERQRRAALLRRVGP